MTTYLPLISVPLKPRDAQGAIDLHAALDVISAFDPGLGAEPRSANEILLTGQSELQLETAVDYAKRAFKLDFDAGAPQVAYRESITRKIEWDYTHRKHTGPSIQHAQVKIRFEPGEPGSGFVFENTASSDAVPSEFARGVQNGLSSAKETGVIAGFPVIDLKCTLIDGAYDDINSSVMAYEIAARACFREAMPKAGPRLLEPMMMVKVATQQEFLGDVIGDLNSRRGQVQHMDSHGSAQVISAMVPLVRLFGYVSTLRSMTQGRAQHTMHFDHYEQVPPALPDGDDNFPMAAALRA